MSRTFSIGCEQCRKHLWIAQASAASGEEHLTLYSGQPDTMSALKKFLFEHRGHPLVFDDNCWSRIAEFDEIETSPEPVCRMRFDLIGAHDAGELRNAVMVVQSLGIRYGRAEPQPIADQWMFHGVERSSVPGSLPSYIELID